MKILKLLFIAVIAMTAYGSVGPVLADSHILDSQDESTLAWLREFSKYKWDIYRGSGSQSGPIPEEPILLELADDERHRMDVYKVLLDYYAVDDPVVSLEYWVYSEGFLTDDLNLRSFVGWGNRQWQFENCAYLEEMTIQELRKAIARTDQTLLDETYERLLKEAYASLFVLASWLHEDPAYYHAQLLSNHDVNEIIDAAVPLPGEAEFFINAGLNDAWFDPATDGQGFFISVYPDSATIILSWLTFDTEMPGQDADAHLGDPCQRWFTAQGSYQGSTADLVVYSSSGGLFDQTTPAPVLHEVGSIRLWFENCNAGNVSYDLPAISASGVIPIQRVATDNVVICESLNYAADQ